MPRPIEHGHLLFLKRELFSAFCFSGEGGRWRERIILGFIYLTSQKIRVYCLIVSNTNKGVKHTVSNHESTVSTFEFLQVFPDEQSAIDYIESRRWPDGNVCPNCESKRTSRQRQYQYQQCKDCRKKFTVRTGTVFERSHIPLRVWLFVMYSLETTRKVITSVQLSRELGITQKSAWFLLHRLREACDV